MFKGVFELKNVLGEETPDPTLAINFQRQIEERKRKKAQGITSTSLKKNQSEDIDFTVVQKQVEKDFFEYKYIAVNKEIDDTKYRLSRMGKFGNFLVKDIYGNMNFNKKEAV